MNNKAVLQKLAQIFANQQKIIVKLAGLPETEDDSIDVDFEEAPDTLRDAAPGPTPDSSILWKRWENGDEAIMNVDGKDVLGMVAQMNRKHNICNFLFLDPRTNKMSSKLCHNMDEVLRQPK